MELTEKAVTVLVDYLYSGEIKVDSDINILMDIAVAAHCFQLQESFIVSSYLILPIDMQEIIDWVHSIIIDNMSHTVRVDRGYEKMEKMSLVTHIQSLGVTEWHHIRSPSSSCQKTLKTSSLLTFT